jgi:hypothetical protein
MLMGDGCKRRDEMKDEVEIKPPKQLKAWRGNPSHPTTHPNELMMSCKQARVGAGGGKHPHGFKVFGIGILNHFPIQAGPAEIGAVAIFGNCKQDLQFYAHVLHTGCCTLTSAHCSLMRWMRAEKSAFIIIAEKTNILTG